MSHKKIIAISVIILAGLIGAYLYSKYRIPPKIIFPEMSVVNGEQEIVKFATQPGKMKVVTFYASWCPDCIHEFPHILTASKSNFANFDFVAITDEGFDKMLAFKEKNKYPFVFYSLTKPFDEYGVYAIPTTYILNSKNEIVYSKVGKIDWENGTFDFD